MDTRITDSDLAEVTGGLEELYDDRTDKYYEWTGGYDYDSKYLCPNCGQPVTSTIGIRYDCSRCNASWVIEKRLVPNLASGKWHEITRQQYYMRQR